MGIDYLQYRARWLLLVGVIGLTGCGGNVESEAVQPAGPPSVKPMLEEIAASGAVGSGAETIREALTTLKASDAAKAEELLKDLDELEAMSDPSRIRQKAKAMADKL
jgi:Arc/MetJ-type ribon-helix-helix transcriptional regulator